MTFQQTYASTIISLVQTAYHSGVLQYHPMTVGGLTIEMTMFSAFNQLAVRYNNRLLAVSVFDSDSEDAQNDTIANLIADIIV